MIVLMPTLRLAAVLALAGARFFAQTTSTEILGLVTDSSGASVPAARVVITRVATGQVLARETSSTGEYSFPLVEIGEYTVHVEKQGFRAKTVSGLRIETQQKARVDKRMTIPDLHATILHQLGIDHRRLTYWHNGRDESLTDVAKPARARSIRSSDATPRSGG